MKLLLKNAYILDLASSHHKSKVDLLLEAGEIAKIEKSLSTKGAREIDLKGRLLTPGWCDLNAHFADPGFEHKEDLSSGSQLAAASGFTDVCVLPNTDPVLDSKSDLEYVMSKTAQYPVNIHPIAAVSAAASGEALSEMLDLHTAGAVAFSDGINPLRDTELVLKSLQYLQTFGGLLIDRPKDVFLSDFGQMHEGKRSTTLGLKGIPAIAEEVIIERDLQLLRYAGGRLHFSLISSAASVDLVAKAKKEGLNVTCDVGVNYLVFDDEKIPDFDTNFKVDPPYRGEKDRKALVKGLKSGVIDAIVTAHLPEDSEMKDLEFDLAAFGSTSMQTTFSVLKSIENDLPLEIAMDKMSSGPRKVLGWDIISIEVGNPAVFSMFDNDTPWTLNQSTNLSKSKNSPFFGQELIGRAVGIINRDKIFLNNNIR
ncbi:MAG: dihydroorotase [Cyclobacteriaceae bacterium]|nr:dihydroorotase [Cyclobacteriaceae bacterium HetDA_MAG_MS6]